MKFRVVVRSESGEESERIIEAPTRLDVYKIVEASGAHVRSVEEGAGLELPHWLTTSIGAPVPRREIVIAAKNLAAMLAAGLTLSRSLAVLERQSGNPRLAATLAQVGSAVRHGESFHDALAPHTQVFSHLFVAMVRAGEESGSLAGALAVVAVQLERTEILERKIRGALLYPAIVLLSVGVVGTLMLIYVVPTLVGTFDALHATLPLATRIIIALSSFLVAHTALVIAAFILLVALASLVLRTHAGKAAVLALALRLPIIGRLVEETYAARTARTLASLLAAGVPVLDALATTREVVAVPYYDAALAEAEERVKRGEAMHYAFAGHPHLYPALMSEMVAVGEETGKSAELLAQVAEFYEGEVEQGTRDLSAIIEPLMVLVIGAAVGVFALSMIAPIYALSGAF